MSSKRSGMTYLQSSGETGTLERRGSSPCNSRENEEEGLGRGYARGRLRGFLPNISCVLFKRRIGVLFWESEEGQSVGEQQKGHAGLGVIGGNLRHVEWEIKRTDNEIC